MEGSVCTHAQQVGRELSLVAAAAGEKGLPCFLVFTNFLTLRLSLKRSARKRNHMKK